MARSTVLLVAAILLGCCLLCAVAEEAEQTQNVIYDDSEPISSPPVPSRPLKRRLVKQEHYYYELTAIAFLIIYATNMMIGRFNNDRIAKAWVAAFAGPDGLFPCNFSLVGTSRGSGDGAVLLKESQNKYKFYASGRRYCVSMNAEIDLLARQDLLSMGWYLMNPKEELINIEVQMNEHSMPPIVLAVATPRVARTMLKESKDLTTYAKQLNEVPKDKLPRWPQNLKVITEQSTVFYELFSGSKLDQVFSQDNFPSGPMKFFRSLHFTSEGTTLDEAEGSPKRILRFSFALPPAHEMEQLSVLMALVPFFIDLVGSYQMSPELRKRAVDTRARIAEQAFKSRSEERMSAAQQRKMERLQAEKAKAAKMGPEAKAKWEEKQQKKEQRRRMAGKMIKIG